MLLYRVSCYIYCYAACKYAKCRYAKCHYAKCHYAKCHYAKYHYAKCHYDECRDFLLRYHWKGLPWTHSSLLRASVNYGRRRFYNIGLGK
jgi:hypothetical protein